MENIIFVNQVGYKTFEKKYAYVAVERLPSWIEEGFDAGKLYFSIYDLNDRFLYTGTLSSPVKDILTGEFISKADFSDFNEVGQYLIKLNDFDCKSYPFEISDNVYHKAFYDSLHYFYLSRCGQEIKSDCDGGKWNHPACHTSTAEIYGQKGKSKKVIGGWHDAGDYGRYTIATTKAALDLLLTYQNLSTSHADKEYISKMQKTILDEVAYAIDWLLQMQREDGGVYHKITCYHFPAFVLPHEEKETQVLAPVSTSATADFAGFLAFASYFYKSNKELSEKMLDAALKAQAYLDSHQDEIYKNPPEITTGGYGDYNLFDERFFALAALYFATENPEYLKKAMEIRQKAINLPSPNPAFKMWNVGYGWGNVSAYGIEILLKYTANYESFSQDYKDSLMKDLLQEADANLSISENASFGTCLKWLGWGSNGHICDQAHILLLAHELTGKIEYQNAAFRQLDYVLGCNTLNLCYLTGNGSNYPQHTHHRPSGALKSTMPGMVSGGPCQGLADQIAKEKLQGLPPMRCFIDNQSSYSTNEVDIYWNSPVVYLISKMI
ncbi:MAG: glycoside hydrolase family 9 protein [Treponema sp.]|nr:glycoside hydrolase family 9 protein [Treponema sp.]